MLAALALFAATLVARQEPTTFGEGELDNPTEFEVSASAAGFLADADRQLAALRAGSVASADRERVWNAIFDAWYYAAESCGADEWNLPDPSLGLTGKSAAADPEATNARRAEGIECAVLRRLSALDERERSAWNARCAPRAADELARALDAPERWAAVERAYPATGEATRAALCGFDRAFAEGRLELARAWLGRAERHVELLTGDRESLRAALARRTTALTQLAPRAAASAPGALRATNPALERARGFGRARATVYRGRWNGPTAARGSLRDGAVLASAPGATRLASGRLVVQEDDLAAVFPVAGSEPPALVWLPSFLDGFGIKVQQHPRAQRAPGRTLTPVAVGDELVFACGETAREGGSAVARIAFPAGVIEFDLRPALRWAVCGDRHVDGRSRSTKLPAELDCTGLDFQPGPALFATEIVWLAREGRQPDARPAARTLGNTATFALAFDLSTGQPLWKRRLAYGAIGPRVDIGRFQSRVELDLAPLHLAARDGRVFAGTHSGVGVLFDAGDGRLLWSFASRRRSSTEAGWLGVELLDAEDGSWLFAPCDSDRGYRLRTEPDLDGHGVLAGAPFEIGELRTLLHAEGAHVLAVTADGEAERLAWIDLERGTRVVSTKLAGDEHFGNRALVGASRVAVVTDQGLALFDRERELYLLDRISLGAPVTGLVAEGDGIVALGSGVVWRVELR